MSQISGRRAGFGSPFVLAPRGMIHHSDIDGGELRALIKSRRVTAAGNARLRIYGRLDCPSGRRMRRENRVFFENAAEAFAAGYRPCGVCLRDEYLRWKKSSGK